ncbi:MAG TPA: BlaI/MecI/CopY family transcriptional regulator [Verrucomicrobiae bacterium]|jgi:BlaI family penicillinase repressor
MKSTRISESEWQIMSIVWENPPVAAAAVVERLGKQKGWHQRTIRTLLDRLVRKGALRTTLEGKRYLYDPLIHQEECVRSESRSFVDRVFGGEPASLLLHLAKETKLTREEIRELKKVLSEKEK